MRPIHPGELLREILEELDISAYALAKSIGKAPIQISRILAGKSSITAPMARLIGAALGTTAQYWVNLQAHYDLEVAKQEVPVLTVEPLVIDGKKVVTARFARAL
jgi:addiction module HigA family antidote